MALRDFFRLKGHSREIGMNQYLNRGHFYQNGNFKEYSFYGETSGICGTDYHISVCYSPEEGVTVSESLCGRSRGSFWTDPEESYSSEGFWKTVLDQVRRFGGLDEIWYSRIGSQDSW